ncbi:MAG: hypothetical protein KJ725_13995 [Gammaproteobacteria bacterium]|nr:hypothetical protein [Gammaproteobacteria bacterium]
MIVRMTERDISCHLHSPNIPGQVGFVFICPGRFEEKEGRPCAGQTGKVLDDGLSHLVKIRHDLFTSRNRYDYLITNAWPQVEYRDKTNRTVPKCIEVTSKQNIQRLFSEINGLSHVVACGELAHIAVRICVDFLKFSGKVAYAKHTSRQSLGCPTKCQYESTVKDWANSVVQQF